MTHSPFEAAYLRRSLKRGLAAEALAQAQKTQADMAGLVALGQDFRPNAKGLQRLALRMQARAGVVRVALVPGGLSVVTRSVREVRAQQAGAALFSETGLIYHRIVLRLDGHLSYRISAVSFCRHALERLVERSQVALGPILPRVDAEALQLFRQWDRAALIEAEGSFARAQEPGVWAGGLDEMALEPDWGLASRAMSFQVFSVRTFLSEAEMRPTLWLRWKDDPTCRVA
ncbi:hypothetical protein [Stagnihabitans tardus]|uniref:Uncharacterized protein n=1 Tax=Stagnihabitans tardus TaxID=2699202 RepID=A0AAE5BWB6_9RHOB|nr:hypothetical protein [Stagnihabitans tardus]NBZ89122.1 hypothetical protein [Stagnihabitans tardus]